MKFFNRTGENLNRKKIKIISQTPEEIIADIERYDNPVNEGTKIDAETFNQFQLEIDTANTNANTAVDTANNANDKSNNAVEIATEAKDNAENSYKKSETAIATANTASQNASTALNTANTALSNSQQSVTTSNTASENAKTAVATANEAKQAASNAETNSTTALSNSTTALSNSDNAMGTANSASEKSDTAIATANSANSKAEEALNQVVEKMGTKVFIGSNTAPETNVNFDSDPQTQINNIKNNTTVIANSDGGFSCGSGATNGVGMQFKGFTLCDENGKIPVERLVDAIYPVGSIYMSVNSASPQTLFGGTWEQLEDRFLLGAGSTYANGNTGGESTHALTTSEMPAHTHSYNMSANATGSTTLTINQIPSHSHRVWSTDTWSSNAVGLLHGKAYGLAGVDQSGGTEQWTSTENTDWNPIVENTGGNGSHNHTITLTSTATTSTGSTAAHNNMPPYLVVYMWKRTN